VIGLEILYGTMQLAVLPEVENERFIVSEVRSQVEPALTKVQVIVKEQEDVDGLEKT
jgi:hypothetical protein